MRKLKIFVVGTRGFPGIQGGIEKHCQELYTRLAKSGCDVTVATRKPYILPENRIASWEGVDFVHLWCPKVKGLEAIIHTLVGVIRAIRHSPDVLHVHAIGPSIFVPLAKLFGLKVVVTNHGPDYQRAKWGRFAKSVLKLGEYMGTRFADRIIVISSTIKDILENKYDRNDHELIPNGVTMPEILPPGETLTKYGLQPRGYVFTASRFVPEKGLHDLIEAYGYIKNPGFKLVLAGDADHETLYSKEIKRIAARTPGVVLTGSVYGDALSELYSNSGLFVLPSYHEGLPIALLEALSYGLPVLVSNIPQHQDIPLPDYRYFPLGNLDALARKMTELFRAGISDTERDNFRTLLQSRYNWDIIAEQTFEVYKSLENGRRRVRESSLSAEAVKS